MSCCHTEISGFEFEQSLIDQTAERCGLLSMEIELGVSCNFACPYCYTAVDSECTGEMPLSVFRDVIMQARELGARKIILLGGEPMIQPHLTEAVEFLSEQNLKIEMFTNGTGITRERAEWLFAHGVHTVLKMNTFDREVQDRMCGVRGAYDIIQQALAHLQQAGYPDPKGTPFLAVSTIMCKLNEKELVPLWIWLRERNIMPYFEMVTPQGRARRTDWACLEPRRAEEIFNEICAIDRDRFGITWQPQPPLVAHKCQRHKYSCLVTAGGDVMPCVGVPIAVGSIHERPLAAILEDSEIIEDLRNHRRMIKGPCASCEMADSCYGCRGAAYNLTGDYLASDPTCWKNEDRQEEIMCLPAAAQPLVPHDPPMRMVDDLVQVGEREARTCTEVREDMPFVDRTGKLDEAAYVELLAQSIAALDGFKKSGNGRHTEGFLLGVKSLKIRGQAFVGDVLECRVYKASRFGEFGIVEGSVRKNGSVLAEGEIKVWHKESAERASAI